MAHNYNDNGTIYEIGGGKVNMDGTVYEIDHGKYNDNGTVYELPFAIELLPNFADNEWAAIIAACHNGEVPSTWVVGNSKPMTINGASYHVDIIGKNHDTYTAGGTAPLTFQLRHCYATKYKMNASDTNSGGWTDCVMRKTRLPAILALMPSEVKAGIREVNKKTGAGGMSQTIKTTADKLFLLSEIEVFNTTSYSPTGEGTQYAWYAAHSYTDRVKKVGSTVSGWWLRTPNKGTSIQFVCVTTGGSSNTNGASNTNNGVSFAFCF